MINEKLKILKMLEEKKISATDAARLLEALNENPVKDSRQTQYNQTNSNTSSSFSSTIDNISKKINSFAKDLEPKINEISKKIISKTSNITENISKKIDSFNNDTIIKEFEIYISQKDIDLKLNALNGNINVIGYNGDKISIKVSYKNSNNNKDEIKLLDLGNKYILDYNEKNFSTISIDAILPENVFNNIFICTTNDEINILNINSKVLNVKNSNGKIKIRNSKASSLNVESSRNKIELINLESQDAHIENIEDDIYMSNTDISNCTLLNTNANIQINMYNFEHYNLYNWQIETNNGQSILNVPTSNNIGYKLNARSYLSSVSISLLDLYYKNKDSNFIEAISKDYDYRQKKVNISVKSSNSSITIN